MVTYKLKTLPNGLTLITVDLPHLDSVTTLVAVGAGSRYETKKINGISHFLEHMFFKGSRKYPTAEIISTLIDGVGAINNAFTFKEYTCYWIKSAARHIELAADILSSEIAESLLDGLEIEREKGVVVEELRMYRDNPQRYVWELYEQLQFGNQPLGWDIGGKEETVKSLNRNDFLKYMNSLYSPKNMALVLAGKLPDNLDKIVKRYFSTLPKRSQYSFKPYKRIKQERSKINNFYKKVDQVNLVLGVEGYDRHDKKRYAAKLLAVILGEGMSSRLFIQVRERRGLAYHVSCDHYSYMDSGAMAIYAGLKLERAEEGLEVILAELEKVSRKGVSDKEFKKAKEMVRGRLAISSESSNFLAQYFGTEFVLDRKIEEFDEFLENIDKVSKEDIQDVAKELFKKENFNLQLISPFKSVEKFKKILN